MTIFAENTTEMRNKVTLYIIDIVLTVLAILVLATSVILEILGGESLGWLQFRSLVLMHIILSLALITMSYIHIRDHFNKNHSMVEVYSKLKRQTKWLFVFSAFTLLTGTASTFVYFYHGHTAIGGVHGKIAFVAIAFMIGHLIKRIGRLQNLRK